MAEFIVQDMTCAHCAATITAAVKSVDPAGRCEIDLPGRRVKVESAMSADRIASAITRAGFSPVSAMPA